MRGECFLIYFFHSYYSHIAKNIYTASFWGLINKLPLGQCKWIPTYVMRFSSHIILFFSESKYFDFMYNELSKVQKKLLLLIRYFWMVIKVEKFVILSLEFIFLYLFELTTTRTILVFVASRLDYFEEFVPNVFFVRCWEWILKKIFCLIFLYIFTLWNEEISKVKHNNSVKVMNWWYD